MAYVSMVLAIICMLYFILVYHYAGLASLFHLFWAALAVFFASVSVVLCYMKKRGLHMPAGVKTSVKLLLLCMGILFFILEWHILAGAWHTPDGDAKYMIVLGCQVRGRTPSKMLRHRLDKAAAYLKEHEDCQVIVSGGQGRGEDIPEALAMQRYLMEKGIVKERIIMEDTSTSTAENIRFCIAVMQERGITLTEEKVLVVSNGFHVSRGVGIAKKQGIARAEALAADTDLIMIPTYYVREALALAKDLLAGNALW